jgi:hypothetical protein
MSMSGWIGVDLDGTLAHYDGWKGGLIGAPIPRMVERVKKWLAAGTEVRIFTARVAETGIRNDQGQADDSSFVAEQRELIGAWCEQHLGVRLKVTATKDLAMVELYDDRAVQVIPNTGRLLQDSVLGFR